MPGFYADGEYDIAGFIVGVVERSRHRGRPSDRAGRRADRPAIGRAAHQRLLAGPAGVLRGLRLDARHASCRSSAQSLGDALLAPHRSYLRAVRPLLERGLVKGMAHITGGGITENLPRILPEGCAAQIDRRRLGSAGRSSSCCSTRGRIADDEMFRAFNMGIGLIVVCAAADQDRVMASLLGDAASRAPPCIGADRRRRRETVRYSARESPPRRPHLGTRIEPSVDHRRDRHAASSTPRSPS